MYNHTVMNKMKQEIKNLFGISLTSYHLSALQCYEKELLKWNARLNLTAISDIEGIRTKHFLDSLSCLLVLRDESPIRLVDIGTGAGFPGIPLKIVLPNTHLTLVDSVGKKVKFCRHIVSTLGLEKVDIIQGRAEDLGQAQEHREQYDWAVARAVAKLPTLFEYLLPLVKMGGKVLSQKGSSGPAEAHTAENVARLLGGHLRRLHRVTLPGIAEDRYLIVTDKVAATPPKYPRRVGVPKRHPLK